MEFLKSNLWEIRKSSSLTIFGGLLSILSALIFYNWWQQGQLPLLYHQEPYPMCWGFLDSCAWLKAISPQAMEVMFWTFGVSSLMAGIFFLLARMPGLGWFFLLVAWLIKWPLYIQDQRLASNINYLVTLLTFVFLLVPNKSKLIRWLITGFYVSQAFVNLSPEWLSGQVYAEALEVPIKLGEWLAAISVLVEFLAPMALWFRELRYFALAWVSLTTYHGLQWYALGYFEPVTLIMLTLLFPLSYYEERKDEREYLYRSFIRPEPSAVWVYVTMAIFIVAQVLPFVPKDYLSINPAVATTISLDLEAPGIECRQVSFNVFDHHVEEVNIEAPQGRSARYRCHPQLRFVDLKRACKDGESQSGFRTIMSALTSRELGQAEFTPVFVSRDVCKKDLAYRDLISARGDNHGL